MIKAIVVDDEKLVRKGFISMIDWATYGIVIVGEAADGKAALELLSQSEADLLFTDITMPGLSGFDLIKQVRQRYPRMHSVVLTCHHEFDYVHEALRLGAIDYIVKTLLEMDNLDQVMHRIVERIRWEESSRSGYSASTGQEPAAASSALLFFPISAGEESSELFRLPLAQRNPLISLNGMWMAPLTHTPSREELKRELGGGASSHWQAALITGLTDKPLEVIKRTLAAKLGRYLFYESAQSPYIVSVTYEELEGMPEPSGADTEAAFSHWHSLKWAFYAEEWDAFIRKVRQLQPEPARIVNFAAALRKDWGELFRLEDEDAGFTISHGRSRTWSEWKNDFRRFSDLVQRRMVELSFSKDVMLSLVRAVQFMRRESGSKINQNDVAHHINMSRSYFSQCFAKFAGESFGEMLRNMRIERAKSLLLETGVPVYEIASLAGFEDDKYFSRVFREHVGKLPTEYRADGGKTV
ncbi:response regulator [Paenibacillus sp. sptzw28]|uniref:response regulator n=1 Tax=Paenibacillus sp. sptzw28 TaxID=715179 RepID=UPI001C6EC3AC|nr:response regulator [Paenibacillus sp. sptzw28]QYR21951.1 response regulator [Paenibacillus sp. sptzw28]